MGRRLQVDFGIHVSEDSIGSMVTGLGAYGLVHKDPTSGQTYIVQILRPAKLPKLQKQLRQWESYGFLLWREISNTD